MWVPPSAVEAVSCSAVEAQGLGPALEVWKAPEQPPWRREGLPNTLPVQGAKNLSPRAHCRPPPSHCRQARLVVAPPRQARPLVVPPLPPFKSAGLASAAEGVV